MARNIFAAASLGQDAERPRNRPAAQGKSEAELEHLRYLAKSLARHVEAMHRPAIDALRDALPGNPFDVAAFARETAEAARIAWTETRGEKAKGAPTKALARETTAVAAEVFERVTGKTPTFTGDAGTGEVIGAFPDFVAAIFAALGVDASVHAQVRGVSKREKSPKKTD